MQPEASWLAVVHPCASMYSNRMIVFSVHRRCIADQTQCSLQSPIGHASIATTNIMPALKAAMLCCLTVQVAHPLGQVKDPALHEKLLPQAAERLVAAKAKAAAEQAALLSLKGPKAVAKQKKVGAVGGAKWSSVAGALCW